MNPYPPAPVFWVRAWLAEAGVLAFCIPLLLLFVNLAVRFKLLDLRLAWKPVLLWLYLPLVAAIGYIFWLAEAHHIEEAGGVPELILFTLLSLLALGLSIAVTIRIMKLNPGGTESAIVFVLLATVGLTALVVFSAGRAYAWDRQMFHAWAGKVGKEIAGEQLDGYMAGYSLPYPPQDGMSISRKWPPGPPPDPATFGWRWPSMGDFSTMYHHGGDGDQARQKVIDGLKAAGYTVYYRGSKPNVPGCYVLGVRDGCTAFYQFDTDIVHIQVYTTYAIEAVEHFVKEGGFEKVE